MKNVYKNLALSLLLFFSCLQSFATHMAGADLTYQYLGNNQYQITYTFYRDCVGIDAQTEMQLDYSSAVCGQNLTTTLFPTPGTGQQISFVCPGALTTCDGGNDPGIQEWEYTGIITLPGQCPDWTFGVSACCRNAAITTIVNPLSYNMFVEANLDNTVYQNSSPVFSNVPIAFECIGQDNYYNHGGMDADGDSLVYSFVNPLNAQNDPLVYDTSYSIANPITSSPPVSINSQTGDVFMHPTTPEVGVMAVKIEEYRNGVLIGSVVRDIQIYIVVCNNQLPVASGINGTGSYSYATCFNGPICFDILTSDPDLFDTLGVLWNHGISNATFTVDSTNPFPVIHFCWTPTLADVRPNPYYFTVTVHDNACPSNGVQSFSYSILLSNLNATVTSSNISCFGGHNGSAAINSPPGSNYSYMWVPGQFTSSSISHLTAGNYSVDVMDGTGCIGAYHVHIQEPPQLNVNVTGQNATCAGITGSATAIVSGGTGGYDYLWSTVPPQNTPTATNLDAGTYSVFVTDDNNCSSTSSVTLTGSSPFTATISSTPATCNANDGTADVTVVGGSGNFSYDWTPNVSSGSSASNLDAGVYSVLVTDDSSGCIQTVSTIINSSTGIVATITSSTDATCQTGEDGSATAMGAGGTPPYSYLWTPGGATTSTVTNLSPGDYTVRVSDYDECPGFATVTIGYEFASPPLELGQDTTICIGTPLVLDAGPGYSYLWSDNSTSQTLTTNVSGVFSVLVTDVNGCENFDAINVTFILCPLHQNTGSKTNPVVTIHPNPASDNVRLNITHLQQSTIVLEFYNAFGNLLWKSSDAASRSFSKEIDLSSLPSGVYYLRVDDGENRTVERVVKM